MSAQPIKMTPSQMTRLVSLGLYVDSGQRSKDGTIIYERDDAVEASIRRTLWAIMEGHQEAELPGVLGATPEAVERDIACALALRLIEPA